MKASPTIAIAELVSTLRDLALAGPADEDDAQDGEQDRRDLGGEEADDAVGVDRLRRWVRRRRQARARRERVALAPQRLAELEERSSDLPGGAAGGARRG